MKKSELRKIIREVISEQMGPAPVAPAAPSAGPPARGGRPGRNPRPAGQVGQQVSPAVVNDVFNDLGNPQTYEALSTALAQAGETPQAISQIVGGKTGRIQPRALPWIVGFIIRYGTAYLIGSYLGD